MKASRRRPLVSDRNRSATEAVGVDQPGEVLNYKYVVFVFILTSALSQLNMFTLFLMSAREKKKKKERSKFPTCCHLGRQDRTSVLKLRICHFPSINLHLTVRCFAKLLMLWMQQTSTEILLSRSLEPSAELVHTTLLNIFHNF